MLGSAVILPQCDVSAENKIVVYIVDRTVATVSK